MAILKVARMGNPILRQAAVPIPIEKITSPEVVRLISDMLDTVAEYDGVGLAAPQVHHGVRLVLLCFDQQEGFEAWINPVITPTTDETEVTTEGCLSVPDLRGEVRRPSAVRVEAYDHTGQHFVRFLEGFDAVVAQHECDHLDGVLYVDKVDTKTLSFLKEFRRYTESTDGLEEEE
jgi:peptide deformylase